MNNQQQDNKEQKQEITVKYNIGEEEIILTPTIVQGYIVGTEAKITIPEFKFFTELCKIRKLNPFLKEAYLIKYKVGTPAQIVVGKDAILKRAVLHPQYDGMESGIIVKDTETGKKTHMDGTFYDDETERVVGGWAKVYRKDWSHPIYSSVNFNEVAGKKFDGTLNSNWAGKGATMIEKVAKVRALREAFVEELSGMYEAEELNVDLPKNTTGADKQVVVQEELPIVDVQEAQYEETTQEVNINEI